MDAQLVTVVVSLATGLVTLSGALVLVIRWLLNNQTKEAKEDRKAYEKQSCKNRRAFLRGNEAIVAQLVEIKAGVAANQNLLNKLVPTDNGDGHLPTHEDVYAVVQRNKEPEAAEKID